MQLNKLRFACILNRMIPDINGDLIQIIYTEYTKTFYDKYTLFELISFMDYRNIYMPCLDKKNICKIIVDNKIDILDKSRDDPHNKTKWKLFNLRYIDYTTYYTTHVSKNIICIDDIPGRFEIMPGDIFKIDKISYRIDIIKENTIILEDINAINTKIEYDIQDFIDMIDTLPTAIMSNQLRENAALHAYMERSICMRRIEE